MTKPTSSFVKQGGFTLVELLIVAIILAILAAIVVPQFANTAQNAGASALRSDLSAIRSAIELYSQQHNNGVYPGAVVSTGGALCTSGVAGLGALNTQVALTDQLTRYTNGAGQSCTIADNDVDGTPEFPFGPYLKTDVIPNNPVTNNGIVAISVTGDLAMLGAGASLGWLYDTTSGKFIANDNFGTDANGTRFDSY